MLSQSLAALGGIATLGMGSLAYMRMAICSAAPNEWLLVIRNGEMVKAGVGLRCHRGINSTIVKFPASIQKLNFSAQQITKEMQGVEVSGFVMWTVFREKDGPFRAYRYMNGMTPDGINIANENLKNLTESIIRSQVANMDIKDVVANRDMMRENVRKNAAQLVQGWGIWMETIEVTDVKILSSSLFENLQAEFREEMRSKAELLQMNTNKRIEEERADVSLQMSKLETDRQNQQLQYEANEELKTQQHREKLMQEKTRIQESELALQGKLEEAQELQRRKMAMTREETSRLVEVQQQQTRDTMQQMAAEAEAKAFKTKMEAQQCMSETNLKVLSLETSKQIYNQMESMKVLHVSGGGGGGDGVEKMVPGLVAMQQALTMAKD
mmetsp:Transcript_24917/g.50624  ORF Transcript_24917/g.50624 Transcript_24917/m.50624 type:complete len:383 (+) Transcript_24917:85-1233(+)|eukprot:CAMPEP_0181298470 /NCGR_PEP_ID=MMETSP1101-20121128/5800_1 /TAXON_ID=46948 /ORGANISM="Rhodomonas abbreviata, Strain Caron Lab Isolate" /LENGTH=382 /DNA_ID=CAMNT_0023403495 /DNA_START=85 /DNA_END=1233 /DNA_ORIENTATION=-